jgi:hypothetical protein
MTASIHTFRPRLVDGPLIEVNRTERVALMAAVLIENGSYSDKRDAMRSLMACGKFGSVEIVMLFADALQAAAQEVVAREMSAL